MSTSPNPSSGDEQKLPSEQKYVTLKDERGVTHVRERAVPGWTSARVMTTEEARREQGMRERGVTPCWCGGNEARRRLHAWEPGEWCPHVPQEGPRA